MSKISELSDGGSLQSTDYLIAVRSGGNVKVRPNGAVSGTTGTFSDDLNVGSGKLFVDVSAGNVGIGTMSPTAGKLQLDVGGSLAGVRVGGVTGGNQDFWAVRNGSSSIQAGPNITLQSATGTTYATTMQLGPTGETLFFNYNGSAWNERMRIDSSGRLLVGATSATGGGFDPTLLLKQRNDGGVSNGLNIEASGSDSVLGIAYNGSEWLIAPSYRSAAGYKPLTFHTNGSERVRIDTSGNLLVGRSSTGAATTDAGHTIFGSGAWYIHGAAGQVVRFYETSTGNQVGNITTTTSSTAYNTSSDARLKENIADAESASERIDAIQVRQFDWKADGSHQDYGMIAQELLTVAPEAVSGDPESDDMMGVDYSKLVPMMLKEIQSLRARVAQLEGA